ncbi:MAG: hypothetical protein M0C28_18220, partial [Candidatus Moduliflexus flocculans]|nr:hypothetical protein [Candidatus Moduliflexus flocculans]
MPFYWASGGNPYVAHNAVVFLAFVLALTGTYSLVRHLTGHRGGAAVAAVAYAFCPYVFSHIPHIQLLMTAGIPYSLLAMHRYVGRQTAGRASRAGPRAGGPGPVVRLLRDLRGLAGRIRRRVLRRVTGPVARLALLGRRRVRRRPLGRHRPPLLLAIRRVAAGGGLREVARRLATLVGRMAV